MKKSMEKIFAKDGKSLILAMDFGPMGKTSVDNPAPIIEEACASGVDAVLATYGLVKHFRDSFKDSAVILRVDAFPTLLAGHQDEIPDTYFDAGTAKKLGIDGIINNGYVGRKIGDRVIDVESQKVMTRLARQADELGIAYCTEMMPYNTEPMVKDEELKKKIRSVDAMKVACRIAAEMGADFIKAQWTGPEFSEVLKNTYIPVVALGGPYNDDPRVTLEYVKGALDAGCAGVAIGRNIYGSKNVKGIVSALAALIHENATVDEALKEM